MKKRKAKALRPALQRLEDRTVMNFSFSNLIHSVLPFIGSDDKSKTTSHMTAAQRSALIQKRWDARNEQATRLADQTAAKTDAKAAAASKVPLSNAKVHASALQLFLDRHRVTKD